MASRSATSILSLLFLVSQVLALQVTPNSPCAIKCLDDPTKDVSDPTSSNTFGKDIVCNDANYSTSVAGQKFEECVTCLQTSAFTRSGESDQGAFLYNIQYAFNTCLFGFTTASVPISTPCSTENSCGHLQKALETGDLDPEGSTYGYCSADNNAFLGSFNDKCYECLKESDDTKYLTNFLIGLKAGCLQQVPAGTLIGMEGSVFSSTEMNITYPGYNQTSSNSHKKEGLTQPAIIGLAIGLFMVVVIVIAILYVCWRKRQNLQATKRLTSPLHSRFGATNITSPNDGAYGNPYTAPRVKISQPNSHSPQPFLEKPAMVRQPSNSRSHTPVPTWPNTEPQKSTHLPLYSAAAIPTHPAYISVPDPVPESPCTSIASSNNFPMRSYSSSQNSPHEILIAPPPNNNTNPAPAPRSERVPPALKVSAPETQTNLAIRNGSPSPPYIQRIDTRVPSRSFSRNQSSLRSAGGHMGLGNAFTSQSSPIISNPIVSHGHRFDFELAERERRDREMREQGGRRRKADLTPESAESEEQWPGSY